MTTLAKKFEKEKAPNLLVCFYMCVLIHLHYLECMLGLANLFLEVYRTDVHKLQKCTTKQKLVGNMHDSLMSQNETDHSCFTLNVLPLWIFKSTH